MIIALYPYFKVFHIIMFASWMAGLFYLPRIFVNLAMPENQAAYPTLIAMARRLYRFTFILSHITLLSGLFLTVSLAKAGGMGSIGWLHAKFACVVALFVYQYLCKRHLSQFAAGVGQNNKTHIWYRWFNEIPVVLLLIIVSLAVFKPF